MPLDKGGSGSTSDRWKDPKTDGRGTGHRRWETPSGPVWRHCDPASYHVRLERDLCESAAGGRDPCLCAVQRRIFPDCGSGDIAGVSSYS